MKSWPWILLLATLLFGCIEEAPPPSIAPTDLPDDVSEWIHVAKGVSAASADGSTLNPYPTVGAALEAAPSGAGLLIEAGVYEERLNIEKNVVLSGLPTAAQEVVLTSIDTADVIAISNGAVVRIENLEVRGGQDAALHATGEGTSVKLTDVTVECSDETELGDGVLGSGLVVTDDASAVVNGGRLHGCAAYGVFVDEAHLILDGNTRVSSNNKGGVRLEWAQAGTEVRSAIVENNIGFGVGLFCGELSVVNSEIRQTASPGGGDGVVASTLDDAPECQTSLLVGGDSESQANEIASNQRAGILVSGPVNALIANNRLLDNGNGGVWVVGMGYDGTAGSDGEASGSRAEVEIVKNLAEGNLHVGIGIVDGALVEVKGNAILDTLPIDDFSGETSHGDGVFVELAESFVYGNSLRRNVRYGILMRSPAESSCIGDDNIYEDNMDSHKWEHSGLKVRKCDQTWVDDDEGEKRLDVGGQCTEEEREAGECDEPARANAKPRGEPTLTCDAIECLLNGFDEAQGCPPASECESQEESPGGNAYLPDEPGKIDCTNCFVEQPDPNGAPCPNDAFVDESLWPCCKPNSVDGLEVSSSSSG